MAALLIGIDLLVAYRAVDRLMQGGPPAFPEAPLFLLLLLALHVLLILMFGQLRELLRAYDRVKEAYTYDQELAQQIIDSLDVGVSLTDAEGRFVHANAVSCALLGVPREQLVGRPSAEFMVFPTPAEGREQLGRPLTAPMIVPVKLRRPDGETHEMVVKVTPRWRGGRVVGGIATNLSEERARQFREGQFGESHSREEQITRRQD